MMERVDLLFEPVRAFLIQIGGFAPRLLIALGVMLVGWLFAKGVRFAVGKALRAVNFNVVTERAGVDTFLERGGVRTDTIGILAGLLYWLVVLAALVIAFNGLGLTYITDLLGKVVLFVPKVVVALLIVTFGAYFARFVADAVQAYCTNVGIQDSAMLARVAQYAILVFVVLIALEHVEVAGDIVQMSFLIVLAGLVFALALAFGLGSRHRAAELLDRWWPRRGNDDGA
jgi:hypothetical protein